METDSSWLFGQVGISSNPTFDDFIWASLIYRTRVLAIPDRIPDAIIPGLDFCNHAQNPNARQESASLVFIEHLACQSK